MKLIFQLKNLLLMIFITREILLYKIRNNGNLYIKKIIGNSQPDGQTTILQNVEEFIC